MRLLAQGGTPSVADIVQAAEVSRRTIYMYFPSLEQLLLDATLGALSQRAVDPGVGHLEAGDVAGRVEKLSRSANALAGETLHLGRALIRLTVEGEDPAAGGARRGYRRIEWIEQALSPIRGSLTRKHFDRLVSALSVLIGWEPLIVLKDLRRVEQNHAEEILAFAARAVVDAALRREEEQG